MGGLCSRRSVRIAAIDKGRDNVEKNGGFDVDLSNLNMSKFPREVLGEPITRLCLDFNKLKFLPEDIRRLFELEALEINHNRLSKLAPQLTRLKLLTNLQLSYNQLEEFPLEITHLKNLKNLFLGNNKITMLPQTFGDKLRNLEELDLRHNKIIAVPDSFVHLKKLTMLDLSFNEIQVLPRRFGELKLLETLILSHNKLVALPMSCQNLVWLRTLHVPANPISQLNEIIIFGMKNLYNLKMDDRQLKAVKITGMHDRDPFEVVEEARFEEKREVGRKTLTALRQVGIKTIHREGRPSIVVTCCGHEYYDDVV